MRKSRMPVAFSVDLAGTITSWSEGARIVLGYESTAWLGRPFALLFTADDVERGAPEKALAAARDRGSASLAGWRMNSDGNKVFMHGEVTAQYDAELEPVGFTVLLLPAVNQPESRRRRNDGSRRVGVDVPEPGALAGLFNRSDERFYVLDDQLNFVYVNEQAAQRWGRERSELVGGNLLEAFPQVYDTEFLAAHLRAVTEGVPVKLETHSPLSDALAEVSIFPNRDQGLSVLLRDPFDHSLGVVDARQGDERLTEAYAALELAVLEWSPGSGALGTTGPVAGIFGLPDGSSLPNRQAHLDLLHPSDLDGYLTDVDAAVAAGERWRCEYRIVRPSDGDVAWLEEVAEPVADTDDGRYELMVWDITRQKLAEERSRSSQRHLQRELAANRRLEKVLSQAGGAEEPQEALGLVVAAACDLFAAVKGSIRVLVPHEAKLRIVAQRGHDAAFLDANAALDVDAVEFDAQFVRDEEGKVALRPGPDTPYGHDRMEGRAYCERWVPLTGLNDRVVGLLTLTWNRAYRFTERDQLDLTMLARLAAVRAEHHLLEQRARDMVQRLEQRAHAQGIELLQSEVRFRRAFEVGPVASCITTVAEDRFIEVNDGYVKLTGYPTEEVVGRTSRELGMWSSREDQAKLEAAFDTGGGFREVELRLRTKDGRVRDILLSGERIVYQGQDSWLKMFNDVTEQHRSQEELMAAIRQVMSDAEWFGQSVVQKLAEIRHGAVDAAEFDLSSRETQVLELVAAGVDDDVIAETLGISRKTVRNHLTNVYAKTGVHSRSEAIIWARDRGIVARQVTDR